MIKHDYYAWLINIIMIKPLSWKLEQIHTVCFSNTLQEVIEAIQNWEERQPALLNQGNREVWQL